MGRLALSVLILSAITLIQSCGPEPLPCMRVSSSTISETREIKDFDGIVNYMSANLIITQGPEHMLKLTGPENVVEFTKTSVVDHYLIISTDDCFNGSYDLTIEVTAPDYELINISEAGTLKTTGRIEGQNIHVELFGSVVVNAAIEMDSIFTTNAGSGELILSGATIYHQMTLSGFFEVNGFELVSNHTTIELNGTGNCEIFAQDTLDVAINGHGNVYYKGSPTIISDITGIGEIIDSN